MFVPKAKATDEVSGIAIKHKHAKPIWPILAKGTNKTIKWRKYNPPEKCPESYTREDVYAAAKESRTRLAKILHQRDVQIKGQKPICEVPNTRPITEGEIGPIESMFTRVWTEDGCKTIVRERKTFEGKIVTDRAKLPEPAKMLHINFGRVIAICENNMYGEKIQFS